MESLARTPRGATDGDVFRTLRELAFKPIYSHAGVAYHLQHVEETGYLDRDPGMGLNATSRSFGARLGGCGPGCSGSTPRRG